LPLPDDPGEAKRPAHLLHVFATFTTGGPQMRTAAILNRIGDRFRHTIVPMDGNFGARARVAPDVPSRFVDPPPRQSSLRYPVTMRRFIRDIAPDLVLTYNWGAMDGFVGAATLGGLPLIHTEDGFGPEEATRLLARRVWTRRLWLRRAYRVVVPSRKLLGIALKDYKLPEKRIEYIANGVDTQLFSPGKNPARRTELNIPADAVVFGFVGRLGPEKNLAMLLHAFAAAGLTNARLLIVGEGESAPALRKLAAELGLAERVIFAGATLNPVEFYRALDVFTMCSVTEQAPISLLEAMGCGLPAVCTDVGDMKEMLGEPEAPAVVASGDTVAYAAALRRIAEDAALRKREGVRNRERCVKFYSVETMVGNYRKLYIAGVGASHAR
jgi:glycosyltransferase involved in cell wall biosynthesis